MKRIMVDLEQVNAWRRDALLAWLCGENLATAPGWSLSPADVGAVVGAFGSLRIDERYHLVGFQFRDGDSGNGLVLALPRGERGGELVQGGELLVPERLRRDAMQAIRGDDTPESYLAASILRRELKEFGAFGHGAGWMDDQVMDDGYWRVPGAAVVSYLGEAVPWDRSGWVWLAPQPDAMDLRVDFGDADVTVCFYTYHGRHGQRIRRHVDRYARGSWSGAGNDTLVATR